MDSEFLLIRKAHDTPKESLCEHNDEILERIYMGCRFKNDTDRVALRSKSTRKTLAVHQDDHPTVQVQAIEPQT